MKQLAKISSNGTSIFRKWHVQNHCERKQLPISIISAMWIINVILKVRCRAENNQIVNLKQQFANKNKMMMWLKSRQKMKNSSGHLWKSVKHRSKIGPSIGGYLPKLENLFPWNVKIDSCVKEIAKWRD